MVQTVYADVLFLIDFSMDFLALYITAYLLKIKFKTGVSIIAAAIGAVFSVLTVIIRSSMITVAIAVSIAMCMISFIGNKPSVILKSIILFYVSNALLGGAMTFIFNLFTKLSGSSKNLLIYGEVKSVSTNMPLTVFILASGILLVLIKALMLFFKRVPSTRSVNAYITVGENKVSFILSEDTGNTLSEPISGEAVLFLSEISLKKLVPEEYISALNLGKGYYSGKCKHKFRILVYGTVSGKDTCGCFKPDQLKINGKICNAWIALGKNLNSGVDGIVPSSLLI